MRVSSPSAVRRFLRPLIVSAVVAAPLSAADPVHDALQAVDEDLKPGHYTVKTTDLDGDGTADALALTNGKSSYCGSGGCTLFILRGEHGRFTKVGAIRVANAPIYVRKAAHHGWKDLVVRVRGGGATPRFAVVSHDGNSYPAAPGGEAVTPANDDRLLFEDPPPADGTEARPAQPAPEVPAQLKPDALVEFDSLPPGRKKLVETALRISRERKLSQYIFGSDDPDRGGFDCSGAMSFILKSCALEPPRTSSGQYDWVAKADLLTSVPPEATSLDNDVFSKLRPGDLLFWTGTYQPTDGRTNRITHVQMYLGKEKKDGRPVMIGSSDGRSYRGKRQCGCGVFDFRLPRKGSRSHFAGYGPPPGIADEE